MLFGEKVKVLSVASIKGGVGKTGGTVGIAGAYSELHPDKNVLVIDCDPQGNSSKALGHSPESIDGGTFRLFDDKKARIRDVIRATQIPNLFVVPTNMALSNFQFDLQVGGSNANSNFILRDKLEEFSKTVRDEWLVVIDTRPNFDVFTVNALIASDRVLIPVSPCEFALDGFKYLINNISYIRNHNRHLRIMGAYRSMWEKVNSHNTIRIEKDLREVHSEFLFEATVPDQVCVKDTIMEGVPVNYNRKHRNSGASNAYRQLAEEMENRWDGNLLRVINH